MSDKCCYKHDDVFVFELGMGRASYRLLRASRRGRVLSVDRLARGSRMHVHDMHCRLHDCSETLYAGISVASAWYLRLDHSAPSLSGLRPNGCENDRNKFGIRRVSHAGARHCDSERRVRFAAATRQWCGGSATGAARWFAFFALRSRRTKTAECAARRVAFRQVRSVLSGFFTVKILRRRKCGRVRGGKSLPFNAINRRAWILLQRHPNRA